MKFIGRLAEIRRAPRSRRCRGPEAADRATSKSSGHARHERTDKGDLWHIYAICEHEHVRTPNGWRISEDQDDAQLQDGNPKLLDETFALATKL
jgi:hypothetical protein